MEQIASFVSNYGYIAVLLGSLVEGESIILTASAFAAAGLLSIKYVWAISFLGTLFADQCLFYLGRYLSTTTLSIEYIQKYSPQVAEHIHDKFLKVQKLLRIYPKITILGFRFIFGIRTISPIAIGITRFPPMQFAILNIISAFLWSVISCGAGYCFGQAIIESAHFISIILLMVYGLVIYYLNNQINNLNLDENQ